VACIGPSGERLSLISRVMRYKGRAAGRSGVAAVTGSKKLKAIAVNGTAAVPVAEPAVTNDLRRNYLAAVAANPAGDRFRSTGTRGHVVASALDGDSPVKNWGGIGVKDWPDPNLPNDLGVIARQARKRPAGSALLAAGER
jgi:aldehyde:ferredoxin oxidoreductase